MYIRVSVIDDHRVVTFGSRAGSVIICKIVGNQVVHVDILQHDLEVARQCNMGVGADLCRYIQNFAEVSGDLNALISPAISVEIDSVFQAIARCKVGNRQRACISTANLHRIVAGAQCDRVIAAVAKDYVVPCAAIDYVIVPATVNIVVPAAAVDRVAVVISPDVVVPTATGEVIITLTARNRVVPVISGEHIVAIGPVQSQRCRRCQRYGSVKFDQIVF